MRVRTMAAAGVMVCLMSAAALQAQNTAYLREMPSVARVIQDITGKDEVDEVAREIAALFILRQIGQDRMQGRQYDNAYTPEEQAFYGEYTSDAANDATYGRIKDRFDPACRGSACPHAAYVRLVNDYVADRGFRRDLKERYFSKAWLAAEREEKDSTKQPPPTSPTEARENLATTRRIVGGILIIVAVAAFMYVRYREFKSTNQTGVREYSGFLAMVASNLVEGVLALIGVACLLYGGWLVVNG